MGLAWSAKCVGCVLLVRWVSGGSSTLAYLPSGLVAWQRLGAPGECQWEWEHAVSQTPLGMPRIGTGVPAHPAVPCHATEGGGALLQGRRLEPSPTIHNVVCVGHPPHATTRV